MSLVSYEPWNLLDRFHQQLNHLSYSDKLFADSGNDYSLMSSWRPAVDIKKKKIAF